MSAFKIFHNSRCSKSRQALQILQDSNCDIEIFNYLETDLDISLIKDVLKKDTLTFVIDREYSKPLSLWNHFDGEGLNHGGAAEF